MRTFYVKLEKIVIGRLYINVYKIDQIICREKIVQKAIRKIKIIYHHTIRYK